MKFEKKVGNGPTDAPEVKNTAKKLSYEELENVCRQLSTQAQQLSKQNQQLRAMINEANLANLYKRLDYLFEVIEKDNAYLSVEFKQKCADEIETLMATPDNSDDNMENTDGTEDSVEDTTEENPDNVEDTESSEDSSEEDTESSVEEETTEENTEDTVDSVEIGTVTPAIPKEETETEEE